MKDPGADRQPLEHRAQTAREAAERVWPRQAIPDYEVGRAVLAAGGGAYGR